MLPSILAKQLVKGIGDYIETTFPMTNAPFKGSLRKLLQERGAVFHEPYLAARLPFRTAEAMPTCFEAVHPAHLPYVHQQKAFERLTGDAGQSTLIATGTGSGKTECFLYPILEYCYRHRGERGIKALIIYPMNALAGDQAKRIAELIYHSPELRGNVTAGMYVGGHGHEASRTMNETGIITDRETMLNSAPDILLTNYKMLDYLLVRPKDAHLWEDNKPDTLKYIVADELHTFDGAQGTDLACLLRRLKFRLGILPGTLCCIGTSATMGSKDNSAGITAYAQEIFGEPFGEDAVITEDRLSADEFFAGYDANEFWIPSTDKARKLDLLAQNDNFSGYIKEAAKGWFPGFDGDLFSDEGRIALGDRLMHHGFMQAVIRVTEGKSRQVSSIAADLGAHYRELKSLGEASEIINSLYALISHARTGAPGKTRPFLNVQAQLWLREMRRLLARVDGENIDYEIAHNLNGKQAAQYLPVVNCRDCGLTGWVFVFEPRANATLKSLEAFYNLYFRADKKVVFMFPTERKPGMNPARLCPKCLQLKPGDEGSDTCGCGAKTISVMVPRSIETFSNPHRDNKKQYVCPCCGSRGGIGLMGLRSPTEISASLSQMFASRFNDDKKTLAFSDNVQDASHRAGFFNVRTWHFGLRTAIQKYCIKLRADRRVWENLANFAEFQEGFLKHWHGLLTKEEFVSFFIAPNMTWMRAYEGMTKNRKLGNGKQSGALMRDIEKRIKYEIMLEYGMSSRIGRTLEKSALSMLSFDRTEIFRIADAAQARTVNESGTMIGENILSFRRMVFCFLNRMRLNGAFADDAFEAYTEKDGKDYLLSNDFRHWMPGLQRGRNVPRFLTESLGGRTHYNYNFDFPTSDRYAKLLERCMADDPKSDGMRKLRADGVFNRIGQYIFEEAANRSMISEMPSPAGYKVYGLNKEHVYVTDKIARMRCDACGMKVCVPESNADLLENGRCFREGCSGHYSVYKTDIIDYYGRLYETGDLARVNAKEHTGLLERKDRESIENDFKLGKDSRKPWDPNVLSCTPTLEMGIDIGDLSSVILCSIPRDQSSFLQRAGRAGRKDGNALILSVANAAPHDLYFYADPSEMISGDVTPPKVFLRASAVLERQLAAFCMDSWVREGIAEKAIPDNVGVILKKWDARPKDMFPFNFLAYAQSKISEQLNAFMGMFPEYLDDSAKEALETFAKGNGTGEIPMHIKILDAFEGLRKQQNALKGSVKALREMIKELQAKPSDPSFDEDIKKLNREEDAISEVLHEIERKNVFNFLSDEGLLPNYAFPEAGIILRAVLYRKEEQEDGEENKKKPEKMVYEYSRSASSAISEFAPNNSFYADGRKLTIDQVDLTTSQAAKWRLCPNCSHAQLEETGRNAAACPRCGSPGWADSGQVRSMLKVQMVYSNMDYRKSMIGDESEDRSSVFYCKQLLVEVDEDRDISCAYKMNNEVFPFGYEFARKATLREINFGESDMVGEMLSVCGAEEVRKGFKVCKHCGKIQSEGGNSRHSLYCKTQKNKTLLQPDAYEECLFLYREFSTEILRLLIPATTLDETQVKVESFVAAFMLGMKEYFGNVDHLRAAVVEVPVPESGCRKKYLVIYDTVPGGTGYLKQLMQKKDALIEIFEKALFVLENCPCKDDPQKDGCYHCLYAYRLSRQIGNISRTVAIDLLKSILSGKECREAIRTIGELDVNPLLGSALEENFIAAVKQHAGANNVRDTVNNGKHCYYLMFGNAAWEAEPQVLLDASFGVAVKCKPDFVFWPKSAGSKCKPVAVFTDGFLYHKDKAADDTLKREAICRSRNFRVWALSWKDVQSEFSPQGDYYTETLASERMPSGPRMYKNMTEKYKASAVNPGKLSSFELLIEYLKRPDAEDLFKAHATAYGYSLLEPETIGNAAAYADWKQNFDTVGEQTRFADSDGAFSETMFGSWEPRSSDSHFSVHAGIALSDLMVQKPAFACAVLNDETDGRTSKYEAEWNGFWRFFNIMQFCDEFVAVSSSGLDRMVYLGLRAHSDRSEPDGILADTPESGNGWQSVAKHLDNAAKSFAEAAIKSGIPAPEEDNIGYEAEDELGTVVGMIEIAWPDKKIGFMTEAQTADREKIEALGWRILSLGDASDQSIAELFGGEDK